ncbi:cob(I)yrinic acid a,c-diamide adenosyltransferase [Chitinispirillales bacterium ANBcel5]|uniref:cob(I)yrinic acid a,c-diamide adenosyltransferase n=1 Tax=Cellulosispirillum alkaliphilum TaxID=3039283 RepID=UPI002A52CB4E|nr:cob(I)yrinic acid a,c-diamide adenosyltransferase [Chitinispirillales bacterium ANBcel5]
MKGYLQVYTGNGKGKTTASIGLAIRAAGAGLPVLFAQFVKGMKYSEIGALERYSDLITIKQYGRGCFIEREAQKEDIEVAQKGLNELREILQLGEYKIVILDEANIALYYKLFTVNQLIDIIRNRKPDCEVVVTGRYAPQDLIDEADLVTEMKEVKHYYTAGVQARKGVEC